MVRFITLLVGLVIGWHNVAVEVSGPVARVEVRLDGRVVGARNTAPWIVRCDLGREPRPGELTAVAYDADGQEIGRDSQRINVPGDVADATILPERDESGRVVSARVTWQSPAFDEPKKLIATVGDERVRVDSSGRIDLRGFEPGQLHVLDVELRFADDVVLHRGLVFGTGFSGETESRLSAVPVTLDRVGELPDDLDGWFEVDDEPVTVVAAERGDAVLVVVRESAAEARLLDLERYAANRRGRDPDRLSSDTLMRMLVPEPILPTPRDGSVLFPISDRSIPGEDGLFRLLTHPNHGPVLGDVPRVAEGVATAALDAARGNRRRAVLLVLDGRERADASRFSTRAVREYLRQLRVPLVIWSLSGAAVDPSWGEATPIGGLDDFKKATLRLRALLDSQRMVWLTGHHLPNRIQLGEHARGISLAGAE